MTWNSGGKTSIGIDDLVLDPNNTFFVEEYASYDNVMYRNIYYIANYTGSHNITIDEQEDQDMEQEQNQEQLSEQK